MAGQKPPENNRPPLYPPTINEAVLSPKRQMREIRDEASKRLKKPRKKFEKLVRKYFKKNFPKERYLQFYDIGYRFEAVFCEIDSDGLTFLGEALNPNHSESIFAFIASELSLPSHGDEIIELRFEKDSSGQLKVLQLVAIKEHNLIMELSEKVHQAPRQNPGL